MRQYVKAAAVLSLLVGWSVFSACGDTEEPPPKDEAPDISAFVSLPSEFKSGSNPLTEEKIDLGRKLYYDTRLSKDDTVSCNSCHALDAYGVDGLAVGEGIGGATGARNSPTVYNAAGHVAQFWDGRAPDVEAQAGGPILAPPEMGMPNKETVVELLKTIPGYVDLFARAFPTETDAVTYENLQKAIGAFERKLVTPSRFDAYLQGDKEALTDAELEGLRTFVNTGCTQCHNGVLLGGNEFEKAGLANPWFEQDDLGRFNVTGLEEDKMYFKVPSLRNIEKTAPYFNGGEVSELKEAVRLMGYHQLNKELSDADQESIVTFLKSLTGELPPESYIGEPDLPADGPNTPQTPQEVDDLVQEDSGS